MTDRIRHLIVAVLLILTFVALRLVVTGPDELRDHAHFENATGASVGPEQRYFGSGLDGDGATFAIIALDPFGQDVGRLLHEPSYRYLRFGYSWLASAVVGGTEELVLLGLSVVGMVAVGLTAYIASQLSDLYGRRAWLLVTNPALILGFIGDTAEPLALALLAGAIYSGSAVVGWSISLVRPSYLIGLSAHWRVALVGLATAAVSKIIWSRHFSEPLLAIASTLSWPFGGILAAPSVLGWLVMIAAVATLFVGVANRDLSWVTSGFFVICFAQIVVATPTNALRAAGFLPVLWAFGPNFRGVVSLRELFALSRSQSQATRGLPR